MKPHTLYRFWDGDGVLLYVGITDVPGARFKQHAKSKDWWWRVAQVTVEHFESRAELELAEVAAIQSEKPLHNITHGLRLKAEYQTKARRRAAAQAKALAEHAARLRRRESARKLVLLWCACTG